VVVVGEKYVKLEDLINRRSNLTIREREAIIEYVKTGDQRNKNKKDYITKCIIIVNSFFEYGFRGAGTNQSSGRGMGTTSGGCQ
jgi:hypothetical protein